MTEIKSDPALLAEMMTDGRKAGPLWRPAAYWQSYCKRIERELERSSLNNLRTNQALLKGYAVGGVPLPTLPGASWKRVIWRLLERVPGTGIIHAENRRLIRATHRRAVDVEIKHARLALDRLADSVAHLAPPSGLSNGGAEDAFDWRGHTVTADWVRQVARLADFYKAISPHYVTAIVEIGPGLGLSTLAHMALNPNLKLVINCDIPPVLYIATQFLKSFPQLDVVDYRDVSQQSELVARSTDRPTLYQLAPWQLPGANYTAEAFFNAFSFQEMEPEICASYAQAISEHVTRFALLHSSVTGHQPGAGGQRAPVTMDFLKDTFGTYFSEQVPLGSLWADLYGEDPNTMIMLAHPQHK